MPGVREVVWLDDTPVPEGLLHFEDLRSDDPALDVGAANDDWPASSTPAGRPGRSKGVMLSHTQPGRQRDERASPGSASTPTRVYLHAAPMFHLADGASTFASRMSAARHAFVPRFDPVDVLQTIQPRSVTHALLVPTMINMIVNLPDLRRLRLSTLAVIALWRLADARGACCAGAMQVLPGMRVSSRPTA